MAQPVVIVGAGQAGGQTALSLARRGYPGPITLIGAEALPPYERPPLSKQMLADPAQAPALLARAEEYRDLGIDLRLGRRVVEIDRAARRVVLDDGSALPYGRLVLATGGQPRRLPFASGRLKELRTVADVAAIADWAAASRCALVIGGGVIGLEVAATLRRKGLAVTVVEVGSRLLGRNFPAPLAALLADRHRAEGVEIRTGVRLRDLSDSPDGVHAILSDGSVLTAGFAIAGIGIVPDTALAQAAGLTLDDGVVVDEAMRSSDPDILAIGDMAAQPGPDGRPRRCETWQNANVTAERAVASLLGEPLPPPDPPWFWTDQYDLNVQLAGDLTGDRLVGQAAGSGEGRLFLALEGDRLVGAAAVDAGRDMAVCRRLIARRAVLPAAMIAAARFDARAARALLGPAVSADRAPASGHPADA